MIVPLALFAASLLGVAGQWHSTVTVGPLTVEFTFNLTQTGNAIAGTMIARDQVLQIRDGSIQGNRISFSAIIPAGGRLLRRPVTGTLEGAELHLDLDGMRLVATRIQPTAQATRTARLAGLFRLWGTIKFFHPFVAHGSIDWDGALIAAIPKMEDAATAEAYAAAIEAMLSALKDPETHVIGDGVTSGAVSKGSLRRLVRSGYPPGVDYYTDWETVESAAPFAIKLPEGVLVTMRTAEPVDSSTGIAATENEFGNLLPSREQRLLALARYWNVIHYFYGYPANLVAWDAALDEFIPVFESATTWHDYVFAIARLASKTHDSHAWISALWQEFGSAPEVELSSMEGREVVTEAGATAKGVTRGDVLVAIDGEPVENRIDFLLRLYPHSTPQSGLLMIQRLLLASAQPAVRARFEKSDGKQIEVVLPTGNPLDWQHTGKTHSEIARSTPVFGVLADGIGYMDLERLSKSDVDRAFEAVMKTPALILDLRGTPNEWFDAVATRLTEDKALATLIDRRTWHGPDPAMLEVHTAKQFVYPSGQPKYKGRVAVLIDPDAISHAEHLCLFLETAANVTFIGSPTTGVEGDVTGTVLPGGIHVSFSGQEIRHADGRPVQGVGILPNIWAESTIAGFREGRDEVLERAVRFLKTQSPVVR